MFGFLFLLPSRPAHKSLRELTETYVALKISKKLLLKSYQPANFEKLGSSLYLTRGSI
jgi:hypothetical protein